LAGDNIALVKRFLAVNRSISKEAQFILAKANCSYIVSSLLENTSLDLEVELLAKKVLYASAI
jgi:hypothetical protein